MIVPMDNPAAPTSRERVQRLYNKNVELENRRRKSAQARVPSDPNAWQQMRENYEAIILEDDAFSEQHEIEFALWQLHYKRIEELRAHFSAALASGSTALQGGKVPPRPDRITKIRSQFKTFLSEATGFYHDLILKIRAKYGLPLGYSADDPDNQIVLAKDSKKSAEMKKGLMSCHRCLIYLGDLARYKGLYGEGDSKNRDYAAASSYYMQAASLWPSSGNPHHQLAILATYSGDELLAVYRYFRSLAVDLPFSTARDNLIIAFEKNRQSYSQLLGEVKASAVKAVPVRTTGKGRGKGEARILSKDSTKEASLAKEKVRNIPETYKAFCIRFVRLNGILFTRTSLETFAEVFSLVSSDLHELLSPGPEEELNFGSDASENGLAVVRLTSILIFTVHNVNRETESQSYAEILQRSVLLQNAFTAVFEFMAHIVERCILLHDPLSSYLLPGILVFLEWLACHPDVAIGTDLEEKQAAARSLFWNHCISLLNKFLSSGFASIDGDEDETCFSNMTRYDEGETENRLALWEDFELRGFFPLHPAQIILDFSRKHSFGDGGLKERKARVQRILAAGKALANIVRVDQQGIYFDPRVKKFAIGFEPLISDGTVTSGLDMPKSNGIMLKNSVERTMNVGVLQPKVQSYLEGEDEDEVIVFKPTLTEKNADVIAPKWTSYEVPRHGENAFKGDSGGHIASFSTPMSDISLHAALDASPSPATSSTKIVPQSAQSVQPIASNWLVEQQASLAGGLNGLSLLENMPVMNHGLQENLSVWQPSALSLPFPQSVGLGSGNMLSSQTNTGEAIIPYNFDSIMSSGFKSNNLAVKPLSALAPINLKKNPVSRPVRHLGPPPGFCPVPPKQFDEPLCGSDLKDENHIMDDYSWLDGYQLPSSKKGMAANNAVNSTTNSYSHLLSNTNSSTGIMNFPFPGKQVPPVQVEAEIQKGWQDYQVQEHLKLYQEQQQQLLNGNQQSIPLPEQYQGQSLWAGRFFV